MSLSTSNFWESIAPISFNLTASQALKSNIYKYTVVYGKLIAIIQTLLRFHNLRIKYVIVIMGNPSFPSNKTYSPNLPSTTTLDKKKFLAFPYHSLLLSSMLQLLKDYKITKSI